MNQHHISLSRFLVVVNIALLPHAVVAADTNALATLQQSFRKQELVLLNGYNAALGSLMVESKKKGDLDAFVALETEKKRFDEEKAVPSPAEANASALAAVGNYYKARSGLLKQYVASLDGLMKTELQAGRIDGAKAAKAEKGPSEAELADLESAMKGTLELELAQLESPTVQSAASLATPGLLPEVKREGGGSVPTSAFPILQQSFLKQEQALLDEYGTSLGAIMEESKKKGNLDTYVIAETETQRFEVDRTVPEPAGANPAIQPAAKKYHKARVAILKQYATTLTSFIKAEVQSGRIENAKNGRAEKERIDSLLGDVQANLPTKPQVPAPLAANEPPAATTLTKGLVLLMTFEPQTLVPQNGVTIVKDLSGRGNDGKLKGATATPGIAGSALEFSRHDDIVTIPDSGSLNMRRQMTLAAWVRGDHGESQRSDWPRLIDKLIWTQKRGVLLHVAKRDACGSFRGFLDDQKRTYTGADSGHVLDRTWHHLVATVDGRQVQMYLDGVSGTAMPYTGTFVTSGKDMTIGNGFDGNVWFPFKGAIDEVAVYNRALTEEEVRQLYDLGKGGQNLKL